MGKERNKPSGVRSAADQIPCLVILWYSGETGRSGSLILTTGPPGQFSDIWLVGKREFPELFWGFRVEFVNQSEN